MHILEKTGPDAAPGFTGLPWLTAKQNDERRELHGRLAQWLARPEPDAERRAEVDEAVGLVFRIDQGLSRAEELLQGMRTKLLSEAEWSELTFLVTQARAELPRRLDRAAGMLGRLAESGSLSSREADSLEVSLRRLVAAHEFLNAQELPWRGIVMRVELPLGVGSTSTAIVESRVVPPTAVGGRVAPDHPVEPNARPIDRFLFPHVPCLAQSTLTDPRGQVLFRGLRQGFIGIPDVPGAEIQSLPLADLSRLVGQLVLAPFPGESLEPYRRRAQARAHMIRNDPGDATWAGTMVSYQSGRMMALESAAAALCSEPERLQRALRGEPTEIELSDVALLTGNDLLTWVHHYGEQHYWLSRRMIRLNLCGPEGVLFQVGATVRLRQFALCVEDQGPDFTNYDNLNRCVVELLGAMDSRRLEGDAMARVDQLRSGAARSGRKLAAAGLEQARSFPPGAPVRTGGPRAGNRVTALRAEMSRLDRHARALEQAGQQLKDMWRAAAQWPTGADAYGAAARLALVAYLMGETPMLSCSSGRDYGGRLDAEVKILATVTDGQGGQVPPAGLDTDIWNPARAAFQGQ